MQKTQMVFGSLVLFLSLFCSSVTGQIRGAKIGSFDQFSDVGKPEIPGNASFSEPSQTYKLSGSGQNIWFWKKHITQIS